MPESWIDISVPIQTAMVHWPGDPEPNLGLTSDLENGDEVSITLMRMSAHTGTHMDAPGHFLKGGKGIESFPLEAGIGKARLIQMPASVFAIGEEHLIDKNIQPGERLLFKTRNSTNRWDNQEFQKDFTAFTAQGAQFLADAGVRLVGIDYLSIGKFEADGADTHRALLASGIWIVEGLDLRNLEEGEYELICLPLKLQGADGAPARVIVRPLSADQATESTLE